MAQANEAERPTTSLPRPWFRILLERWPSVLAVGAAIVILDGDGTDETVMTLGDLLPLLPLVYVVVVALQRRRATWPVLCAGATVFVLLQMQSVVPSSTGLVALGAAVLVVRSLEGRVRNSRDFRVQATGMVVFGAFAIAGAMVDPNLARHVVGAAWFLHGIWDFVHLHRDEVVARSYAEWCGVLDVLVGLHLLVVA